MATLFDYCTWRGDLDFAQVPFGDLDALALSAVCYLDPGDAGRTDEGLTLADMAAHVPLAPQYNKSYEKNRVLLLRALAETARFREARISRFVNIVDAAHGIQFSAMCCDLDGVGQVICYRGTDATLVGWRENFAMAYECPVPAQRAAVFYLEAASKDWTGPLLLLGHSKGGNLAMHAASEVPPLLQRRIRTIWSFDGPGLDEASQESLDWLRVRDRVRSFIPQSSVIGLLLGYHPLYTIVRSDGAGLGQHDVFTWQIAPPAGFETMTETTFSAQVFDRTLHEWLHTATPAQRRTFVDAVFDVMASTGASTTAEMKANLITKLPQMVQAAGDIDPAARTMLLRLAARFVTLTTVNAVDLGTGGRITQAAGSVLRMLQGAPKEE